MVNELPIGLFDSGLGGLTVLRALRNSLPREQLIYLGDTARTPYGSKSPETIVRYSRECAQFLLNREVKLLIVACNTASSMALDMLRATLPCRVIGTIEPVIHLMERANHADPVGVIGTPATIASGAYQTALKNAFGIDVHAVPCPLFVPLVEQGMCSGSIVDQIVALYLAPLKAAGVRTLILGCTHYPLLRDAIAKFLGPETAIIECSEAVASEVQQVLAAESLAGNGPRSERYYVTDEVGRFNHLAGLFLGNEQISSVQIEQLETH